MGRLARILAVVGLGYCLLLPPQEIMAQAPASSGRSDVETYARARGVPSRGEWSPSLGPSSNTVVISDGDDFCSGELLYNHDDSFEGGMCWQYGGIVPPYYGAFGEGFEVGGDSVYVNCMSIWVTQVGNYYGQLTDIYMWDGGVTREPGTVLYMSTGRALENVPYWPSVGRTDLTVGQAVPGEFTVGYWLDASASVCAWYIGSDLDGYGGHPWTNVAPGTGYPSGWQHPGVVWGSCQSLGFGVYLSDPPARVAPDGSGDYPTIQTAVDAVSPGTTILLENGCYCGMGNRDVDLRGKHVVIRSVSLDPDSCIIDCEGTETEPHRGFVMVSGEDERTIIAALTVRGGHAPGSPSRGGAILCQGASPRIRDCVFEANRAQEGGAVCCLGGAPLLENCILRDNEAQVAGGALCCRTLAVVAMRNCTLDRNGLESGGGGAVAVDFASLHASHCTLHANLAGLLVRGSGVDCTHGGEAFLDRCIISFSIHGCAVYCDAISHAFCQCCDVFGNTGGDWTGGIAGQEGQEGNIRLDPLFCDRLQGDLRLWNSSPCNQETCGLIGAWPVGCYDPQGTAQREENAGAAEDWGAVRSNPNPFKDRVVISYTIPADHDGGVTRLRIFDTSGRCVRMLAEEAQRAGDHMATWDGCDEQGSSVRSGFYFWQLSYGDEVVTRPLVKLAR